MSKTSALAKTFAEALGFKGRLAFLMVGIVGLFFPGLVTYSLLRGIAKGLRDVDTQQMIEDLDDDA